MQDYRSSRPSTALLWLALAIFVGGAGHDRAQGGPGQGSIDHASGGKPSEQHAERFDDPQLPIGRETLARAIAAPVVKDAHASVQVNVDALGNNILGDAANEPSIAIDPTDSNRIVIGWRQFDSVLSNFRQAGYAYSHDGGESWTFPGALQPGRFRSDPVLAADSGGRFFYYSLSSVTSVEMFISDDGGVGWTAPIPARGGDKAWIAIDTTGGLGDGNVYTTWNSQFTCCAPGTDFTRSVDGGFVYQGPDALPTKVKWGTLDTGPEGELYVVGTRVNELPFGTSHIVQKSTNAPYTGNAPIFEAVRNLNLRGTTVGGGPPNPAGLLGQVEIAVDRSPGPSRGNVYVLASVDPTGPDPLDVMLSRSVDGGFNWSAPIRVNDDPPAQGAFQWFATMSVSPEGRIDAVWNDARNDSGSRISQIRYAYSSDAGSTWSAGLAVTPPFDSLIGHPNQAKLGDYYQMISDHRGAALAYAATFNGEQDIYFLRVGDCNGNARHDGADIELGSSGDCDGDGIPDECDPAVACALCAADDDCDDERFCNGVERCEQDRCVPGSRMDCDDGVDCTSDFCSDRADQCVNVTDDSRCEDGTFCNGPEVCNDGLDNDCDRAVDCLDEDCSGAPGCSCDGDGVCEIGEDCRSCPGDCAGTGSRTRRTFRFCCGDGVLQAAEGSGALCDGRP